MTDLCLACLKEDSFDQATLTCTYCGMPAEAAHKSASQIKKYRRYIKLGKSRYTRKRLPHGRARGGRSTQAAHSLRHGAALPRRWSGAGARSSKTADGLTAR